MDFLDLSKQRFSVLEYSNAPVEQEKIDKIIEAGIAAQGGRLLWRINYLS